MTSEELRRKVEVFDQKIDEQFNRLDSKIDGIRTIILEQNTNIYKELEKRPMLSTWLTIISILFTLILGAYGYTWAVRKETENDMTRINSAITESERLNYDVVGRLNTIDKKLIWIYGNKEEEENKRR